MSECGQFYLFVMFYASGFTCSHVSFSQVTTYAHLVACRLSDNGSSVYRSRREPNLLRPWEARLSVLGHSPRLGNFAIVAY